MKSTRWYTLWSLLDHSEWCIWSRAHTGGWRLWEWEQKHLHPTPIHRTLSVYHIPMVDVFSFNLTNFGWSSTPLDHHPEPSLHRHRCHNLTHCHLVFTSSDDKSPERSIEWCPPPSADARGPTPREADILSSVHHVTHTPDPFHFPTATLDDDIWTEE